MEKYKVVRESTLRLMQKKLEDAFGRNCFKYMTNLHALDMSKYDHVTKWDIAKELGVDTCDVAVPHAFVDAVRLATGEDIAQHIVWGYSKGSLGSPVPIDREGVIILRIYNRLTQG